MPKVEWAGQQVAIFLNYTTAGSTFVYGYLADVSVANVVALTDLLFCRLRILTHGNFSINNDIYNT